MNNEKKITKILDAGTRISSLEQQTLCFIIIHLIPVLLFTCSIRLWQQPSKIKNPSYTGYNTIC